MRRILIGIFLFAVPQWTVADDSVDKSSFDQQIIVQVNKAPITWGEIRRELEVALNGRKTSSEVYHNFAKKMLQTLIDRTAVQHELQSGEHAIDPKSVDFAIRRLEKRLATVKETLKDYLKRTGQTQGELRRKLLWQAVWKNYLDTKTDDKSLQRYFIAHQRDYDGTEIRVSQILWKVDENNSAKTLVQKAANVRNNIVAGKITFADAVKSDSAAASKKNAGDLGYIRRHGQNVEAFSKTAFALRVGEISQPVKTVFGIHLIRCTKIKLGVKKWQAVRQQLKTDLAKKLFRKLAKQARKKVTVKYIQKLPLESKSRSLSD